MKADFHLHTHFSGDCETPMEKQVLAAIDAGIDILCFTDHLDQDYPHDCIDFSLDIPAYRAGFEAMRDKYSDRIKLLFGVEFGLQPHLGEFYDALSKQYPFDFILGSTHVSSGIDPYFPEYWEGLTTRAAMERFFCDTLAHLKTTGCYDSMGHLDYVIRYVPKEKEAYSMADYTDQVDECLKYLISHGKALEVNSGGYKAGLNAPHPSLDILKRYRELGGELLTMGSDSHFPQYVGFQFDLVMELLRSVGFRYFTVFEERVGRQIPL